MQPTGLAKIFSVDRTKLNIHNSSGRENMQINERTLQKCGSKNVSVVKARFSRGIISPPPCYVTSCWKRGEMRGKIWRGILERGWKRFCSPESAFLADFHPDSVQGRVHPQNSLFPSPQSSGCHCNRSFLKTGNPILCISAFPVWRAVPGI